MFSANENILLRQHKRRVIEYVESTIPEEALDLGTSVMVMQVSCRQPGCVPLETAITVVFPKPPRMMKKKSDTQQQQESNARVEIPSFPKPLLPNLEESRIGGNFKTRILKPLSDVTLDDVLDALPPNFTGGRRTVESICVKARDMMFAQIGQLVGSSNNNNDDGNNETTVEGRKMIAGYLKICLEEYLERGCVPPEWGDMDWGRVDGSSSSSSGSGIEEKKDNDDKDAPAPAAISSPQKDNADSKHNIQWGEGNILFKRPTEEEETDEKDGGAEIISSPQLEMFRCTTTSSRTSRYKKSASIEASSSRFAPAATATTSTTMTSHQLLEQITRSEHAPGIRRAGCPCCDPDGANIYIDKMMRGL